MTEGNVSDALLDFKDFSSFRPLVSLLPFSYCELLNGHVSVVVHKDKSLHPGAVIPLWSLDENGSKMVDELLISAALAQHLIVREMLFPGHEHIVELTD